ncbi:unnamed protein product, partial [Nesidiocoris tenuis]
MRLGAIPLSGGALPRVMRFAPQAMGRRTANRTMESGPRERVCRWPPINSSFSVEPVTYGAEWKRDFNRKHCGRADRVEYPMKPSVNKPSIEFDMIRVLKFREGSKNAEANNICSILWDEKSRSNVPLNSESRYSDRKGNESGRR